MLGWKMNPRRNLEDGEEREFLLLMDVLNTQRAK